VSLFYTADASDTESVDCAVTSVSANQIVCTPGSLNKASAIFVSIRSLSYDTPRTQIGSYTNNPDPAALGAGLGVSIPLALIIAGLVVFLIYRRKIAKERAIIEQIKTKMQEQIPEEMRIMFNIKNSELEILKKLGEGSFGAGSSFTN